MPDGLGVEVPVALDDEPSVRHMLFGLSARVGASDLFISEWKHQLHRLLCACEDQAGGLGRMCP